MDEASKTAKINGHTLREGDFISLNGSTGEIIAGRQPLSPATMAGDMSRFMSWVDDKRVLGVLTNADTPEDAAEARRFGAGGACAQLPSAFSCLHGACRCCHALGVRGQQSSTLAALACSRAATGKTC